VIPVFDADGSVQEIYGRKIGRALRKGTPLHLYLPGSHQGVWNVEALKASKEVILCESLIDALTFWCAGFRNVTSAYGINGFTESHLEAFRLYGIERVLIAYDRDDAGEKAASSLAEKLIAEEGIECFRIQFPKGMDANEYALWVQPAAKSLGVAVSKAVWLGQGTAPAITSGAVSTEEIPVVDEAAEEIPEEKQEAPESKETFPSLVAEDVVTGETKSPRPPLDKGEKDPPLPTPEPPRVTAEMKNGEVSIHLGDRRWRIRGLEKNMSYEVLRVNLLVSKGEAFYVDTFDLYAAKHRQSYLKQAAQELSIKEDVLKKDLGKVLLKLEELQDAQINRTLNSKSEEAVSLSEEERRVAMKLLESPDLLNRILGDFEKCGVVGEETNKLVGYLAAVSRKLEKPLAVVIQSSSAAGKSSLMEAILSFLPPEEQVKYSAMTGQSLFYMGETDLKHKILAIVEEEGAERAAYALKLLQSEGELMIASTGKDPSTGRLETQEYRVEGPVMIFLTTTAIEIDEELQNRCIVLTVDENREQTRAIHRLQREQETLDGLWGNQERESIVTLHQNAQRLLRPLWVVNPFARELTFLDDRTRTRRDHKKYLTLIRSIALLHQYQRPVKSSQRGGKTKQYMEVTLDDIEVANRLSHQVLGRSLDELAPQTRRLLVLLDEMVTKRCAELEMVRSDFRFSRREIREYGGWSYDQVRAHLERLVDLEYVLVHHGGRGQSFVYELLFDGKLDSGKPQLMGLIDAESLKSKSATQSLGGETSGFGGGLGPHLAPIGASLGGAETGGKPSKINGNSNNFGKSPENAHLDKKKNPLVVASLSRTDSPLDEPEKSEAL
jgi:hypothetical protein